MASERQSANTVAKAQDRAQETSEAKERERETEGNAARRKRPAPPERDSGPAGSSAARSPPDARAVNVIRPSRAQSRSRGRPAEESQRDQGRQAETEPAAGAKRAAGRAAGAAQPPASQAQRDPWALPQSVRDRFVQDRRRFYFPDGTEAFRDRGRRLTTGSENTEVVRSLIEIAKVRGWSEITVEGTETFRREAWRQGRLAELTVRGYRPTEVERVMLVRAMARKSAGQQLELEVSDGVGAGDRGGASTEQAVREGPASRSPGGRAGRELIVGRLVDHGRENYRFDPHEPMSYFVEIKTREGKRTIWGKDLERAMAQSLTQPQVGEEIALRKTGAESVTVHRRERDEAGRVIAERDMGAQRNRWAVEKREFFEARAAAAEVVRNPVIDRRRVARSHPELVGTLLQLRAAELAARKIRDPEDQKKFVEMVRGALADSVERGDPLQPVRLRDRPARAPEQKPRERAAGPVRA